MRYIFYLLIIASISLWTGCGDADSAAPKIKEHNQSKPPPLEQSRFVITDIDKRSTTVSVDSHHLGVAKITQPIVMINLFAPWSPPSCGMVPYLDALQKKYSKELFVISIIVSSDITDNDLRALMKKQNASYFISNGQDNNTLAQRLVRLLKLGEDYPVPLTILFKNGEYTTHYIGATPIEMIKADIEQLRRQ